MKYIDELLTPQIKTEKVGYTRLVAPEVIEREKGKNTVSITKHSVVVKGKGEEEIRQGLNYVKQLKILFEGQVPECEFEFYSPTFEYRGFMIDVCRHFMPVDEIKRIVNVMSLIGYNYFHWHLTDDQGWRFSVDGYPELERISSKRINREYFKANFTYEGLYSDDDLEEVNRFCEERGVTVIPEIEIPGHATALLAAYPEFGCTGSTVDVETRWGIFDNVMNPASDKLWTFLDTAVSKLTKIFGGPFFNIGGDECPRVQWENNDECRRLMIDYNLKDYDELQGWCTSRSAAIVARYGRRAIGWDEVIDAANIDDSVVVLSWRGLDGARKATLRGHNVILCPEKRCYLDKGYTSDDFEPKQWGVYTVKEMFDLDISMRELGAERSSLILGAQCNLFAEQIHNGREAEYMMFPRVFAFADSLWLGDNKNWNRTKSRKKAISELCYNLDLVCSPARWEE